MYKQFCMNLNLPHPAPSAVRLECWQTSEGEGNVCPWSSRQESWAGQSQVDLPSAAECRMTFLSSWHMSARWPCKALVLFYWSTPCLCLVSPYVIILKYFMPVFLYAFLYNVYYVCAKVLSCVNLCKCFLVILFLMPGVPFWREWEVLEPSSGLVHIFNEVPTMCDSNKDGGSIEMWLRALALGSGCRGSDSSSSTY